jgi:flagellar biosynthesis/type III secretory pathway protein FliH
MGERPMKDNLIDHDNSFDEGYAIGYDDGIKVGYSKGFDDGEKQGLKKSEADALDGEQKIV